MGRRSTVWGRWPDVEAGPLWVGIHLHERGGIRRLVGLEVYSEDPQDARDPSAFDEVVDEHWPSDPLPVAPQGLRSTDLRLLSLPALLEALTTAESAPTPASVRYGPDHWRRVAQVVQHAPDRRVALHVAQTFGVPRRTAKSWIRRCRDELLLEAILPPEKYPPL
jgi:hypothetical protein